MSVLSRLFGRGGTAATPPSLPLLEYEREPRAADWLRESMTTFALGVRSFLPDRFEAYARVHHPFEHGRDGTLHPWREVSPDGEALRDPVLAGKFAYDGWEHGQATVGRLPAPLIEPLVEHLASATTTPDRCFFAVWEGHGDTVVPHTLAPRLQLPERGYHVFAGPIEGARTSLSDIEWYHLSANLWWPADRAWCVATEIDLAWTYVGGSRACIDDLLADPRLETVETSADARW
jgi:hypothetical protein